MPAERLQKIIAAAGVASRRRAEELIAAGRVLLNGQVVTELGTKADPEHDHIRVDGKLLQGPERFTYVALNKPKGYVTTVSDEKKRPTVMDLVQKVKGRVYPVGRLDWASEGLILMTNDGALANALMKPASHVPKVYVVKVAGQPDEAKLDKLRRGVSIAEKGGRRVRTAPAKIRLIREGDNPWLEVTIVEGRNRQVRKMFEEVGHHVEKIRRVQYGPLALDVPPGDWRNLTLLEVAKLKAAASETKVASPPSPYIPPRVAKPATKLATTRPPSSPKAAQSGKRIFETRPAGKRSSDTRFADNRSARPVRPGKPAFSPRSPKPPQLEKPSLVPRATKPSFSRKPSFSKSSGSRNSGRPAFAPRSGKPPFAERSSRDRFSSDRDSSERPLREHPLRSGPSQSKLSESTPAQSRKPSFAARPSRSSQSEKRSFAPRKPRPFQSSKRSHPPRRKRD
jgi:23S rRNA pseudouridine2605 synthase